MSPASEYLPKIHNTTRRKVEAGADDTVFDIGELLPLCCPSWAEAGDQRNLVENCDFPRAAELQGSRGANTDAENIFLRFLACGGSFGITPAFGGHELLERGSFPCTEVQMSGTCRWHGAMCFPVALRARERRSLVGRHNRGTQRTGPPKAVRRTRRGNARQLACEGYARRRTETGERLTSAGLPRTSIAEDGDKGGKGVYVSRSATDAPSSP